MTARQSPAPIPYVRISAPARARGGGEFFSARIVRIDHRDARRRIHRSIEEQALGGEIVFHRLVVIEMVAREVGEDGNVKRNSDHAALVEGVARDLGDELFRAARNTFRHHLEQIARFGRGVNRGASLTGDVAFNGADENAGTRGRVEERFGEECGGGFSVCAGDSSGGERTLGMAEERRGGLGERAAAVLDMEERNFRLIDREMVESLLGVSDDANCARSNGILDKTIAVGRAAFHGHEDGALPHAARVVLDARDGCGGAAGRADGCDFGD